MSEGRFSRLETGTSREAQKEAPLAEEREAQKEYGAQPLSYDEIMHQADVAFYEGHFPQALRLYSRALQEETRYPEPWIGQLLSLLLQNQTREAAVWSKRAAEAFPTHPTILSVQGLVMAMQGMTKRGLGASDYAMSLEQPSALCWLARGWLLLEADNENWRVCMSKAADLAGPYDWRVRQIAGLVLERHRKFVCAREYYEAATAEQASCAFLWYRLGLVYSRLGMVLKAVEAQKHALEIRPNFAQAERALKKDSGFPVFGMLRRVKNILVPSRH